MNKKTTKKNSPSRKFLDAREVASTFGVNPQTVRSWAITGKIPSFRPGRKFLFRKADIDGFGLAKK